MGCRRYSAASRHEVRLDEDDFRACDLRAPHRLTRPAFEAHPGGDHLSTRSEQSTPLVQRAHPLPASPFQ